MQKIIDGHLHLFDLSRFRVLWVESLPLFKKPLSEEVYVNEWKKSSTYEIIGAIHIELDTIKEQKIDENKYFIDKAESGRSLVKGVVINGDMLDEDFEAFISNYKEKSVVKGLRHILHVPTEAAATCLKPLFVKNTKILGHHGIMFEACLRAEELMDLYELAKECSNTIFVLNHMGLVDITAFQDAKRKAYVEGWKNGIKELASLPNVTCKISGLASADVAIVEEAVEFCFDQFGEDRVVFASNYPVCLLDIKLTDWIDAMLIIAHRRGLVFTDKFFYKNAERIYGIGEKNDN